MRQQHIRRLRRLERHVLYEAAHLAWLRSDSELVGRGEEQLAPFGVRARVALEDRDPESTLGREECLVVRGGRARGRRHGQGDGEAERLLGGEQPLLVAAPRGEVGAAAPRGRALPARAHRELRPAVVGHAAREEHVEPQHEVVEAHPERAVLAIVTVGHQLAHLSGPRRVVVGPLAAPLRVAIKCAQPHHPMAVELAAHDDAVRQVGEQPFLGQLVGRLAVDAVLAPDDVRSLPPLHHLTPERVHQLGVTRGQHAHFAGEAASQVQKPVLDRATARRLITSLILGKGLFEDREPEHGGRGRAREARKAVLAARQPVVHDHHVPVIVRLWVVHVEAHQIEAHGAMGTVDKDAFEHAQVAAHDVARGEEPVVEQRRRDHAAHAAAPLVGEESGHARAYRQVGSKFGRPAP